MTEPYRTRWQLELERSQAIRKARDDIEPTLRKIAEGCDDAQAEAQRAISALDEALEMNR